MTFKAPIHFQTRSNDPIIAAGNRWSEPMKSRIYFIRPLYRFPATNDQIVGLNPKVVWGLYWWLITSAKENQHATPPSPFFFFLLYLPAELKLLRMLFLSYFSCVRPVRQHIYNVEFHTSSA